VQYLVEEVVAAGIEEIIFITGRGKRAIEDHFDRIFELEQALSEKAKKQPLREIQDITKMAKIAYVRQAEARGDGDAILQAYNLVRGEEAVAILFGDCIIDSKKPAIGELVEVYEKYNDPVVGLSKVPRKEVSKFGVIDGLKIEKNTYQIKRFIEKPKPDKAPSQLVAVGKYVINQAIFKKLIKIEKKRLKNGEEFRLADALAETDPLYGYCFEGTWYDTGSKLGYLKTVVDFGLRHITEKKGFRKYLKSLKI
jgi:UTP--glucose-1-phosphate uridylyltransferase